MRSKLKFMMPIAMFFIAIVFAFASQSENNLQSNQLQGAVYLNGECQNVSVDCGLTQGPACTHGGMQVFLKINGTTCDEPLYRNIW